MNLEALEQRLNNNHGCLDTFFDKNRMTKEELLQLEQTKQSFTTLYLSRSNLAEKELVITHYDQVLAQLQTTLMHPNAPYAKKISPVRVNGLGEQVVVDVVLLLKGLVWLAVASIAALLIGTTVSSPTVDPFLRALAACGLPVVLAAASNAIDCFQEFSFFSPSIAAQKKQFKNETELRQEEARTRAQYSTYDALLTTLESLFWIGMMATTLASGWCGVLLGAFCESLPMMSLIMIGTVAALAAEGQKVKECFSRFSLFCTRPKQPTSALRSSIPLALIAEEVMPVIAVPGYAV